MGQSLPAVVQFLESWQVKPRAETEVAIFPSYVHLCTTAGKLRELQRDLSFGAQDCSTEEKGAFTGEVSASTLKEVGCKYILIGHSERRQRGGETEVSLQKKLEQAFKVGLKPVYCLGETEAERSGGKLLEVLRRQSAVVSKFSEPMIVAYEPVWAIGTGKVATEQDIAQAHQELKAMLPKGTPVLYGGSVNPENAGSILKIANVNGLLVGGASLKADSFRKIVEA